MTRLPTPIRYLETINKHIERHFGADGFVLHEDKSSTIHVDVHVVPPKASRSYFTLVTSGMSDLAMHMPKGLEALALAELCLCLPKHRPSWCEPIPAFIVVTTWAGSFEEFGEKCARMLNSYDWNLPGIDNARPAPEHGEF